MKQLVTGGLILFACGLVLPPNAVSMGYAKPATMSFGSRDTVGVVFISGKRGSRVSSTLRQFYGIRVTPRILNLRVELLNAEGSVRRVPQGEVRITEGRSRLSSNVTVLSRGGKRPSRYILYDVGQTFTAFKLDVNTGDKISPLMEIDQTRAELGGENDLGFVFKTVRRAFARRRAARGNGRIRNEIPLSADDPD